MNFAVNLIFLIKPFLQQDQKANHEKIKTEEFVQ